jgi:pectate lyase
MKMRSLNAAWGCQGRHKAALSQVAAAFAFLLAAGLPVAAYAQTFCANPAGGYKGFGRNTTGGDTTVPRDPPIQVYRVTNLNDSGPGSLRAAVEEGTPEGHRCIVFDVAGTIDLLPREGEVSCNPDGTPGLQGHIRVKGPNVTIDGFSAPFPGITLNNWGFDLHGVNRGVGNVIVRGLRIRNTVSPECRSADGLQIVGVKDFVIDHVSIDQWGDGSLDIAGESGIPAQGGTVQWSIFGKGKDSLDRSLLVKYGARRISLHHNLFINANDRNPYCAWSDNVNDAPPLDEIVCDIRNNLVWGYGWTGTSISSTANVVHNYYFSSLAGTADAALYIRGTEDNNTLAFANGNFSPSGLDIDLMARPGAAKPCGYECGRATPFYADPVRTTTAVTAAHQVVAQAGARSANFGLDGIDQGYIAGITAAPTTSWVAPWKTFEESAATYGSAPQGGWADFGPQTGDFSGGSTKAANSPGATATFSFTGTAVTWLGVRCSVCGKASVSIDGGAPVPVDTAGPDLPPGSLYSEPVFSSPTLASGTHTMIVTVTGETTTGGTFIAVDGFEVAP